MECKWTAILLVSLFSVFVVSLSIKTWSNGTDDDTSRIPTVQTPHGKYIGLLQTYPDRSQITKFLGIPFAKPPVGNLRFMRPQPPTNGNPSTTILANQTKLSCNSVTKKSTHPYYGEDCLYLNVYIPGNQSVIHNNGKAVTYSVMVWLHPGGFVAGSAFPEPTKLVIRGNVIIVMVNYRMGVFGFLTTNDAALPGNNGLWDQYMAIKWVKDNIRYFGGNQDSITIFGESSGSMSSHILALSPVSSNLFHKVILQSGVASSLISRDYVRYARNFGRMVGCGGVANHDQLAKCLRNVSVSDILEHSKPQNFNISAAQMQVDFIWMPIVDGEMIKDNPDKLMNNQTYLKSIGAYDKDYMIGLLNNEGGLMPENFLSQIPLSTLQNVKFFNDLLDYFLYSKYGLKAHQTSLLTKQIKDFYFGSDGFSYPLPWQTVIDVVSDAVFVSPATEAGLHWSICNKTSPPLCQDASVPETRPTYCSQATTKVFFYHFDYCPSNDPCRVPCMSHGYDFQYEFPKRSVSKEFDLMSDIFIDILTTFGKNSDPGSVLQGEWPTYEPYNQYFLRLSPKPAVRQNLHTYRARLWSRTLPNIVENLMNAR